MKNHKYYCYFHKYILHYKQSFYITHSKKASSPPKKTKATLPHHNNIGIQLMTYILSQHTKKHIFRKTERHISSYEM